MQVGSSSHVNFNDELSRPTLREHPEDATFGTDQCPKSGTVSDSDTAIRAWLFDLSSRVELFNRATLIREVDLRGTLRCFLLIALPPPLSRSSRSRPYLGYSRNRMTVPFRFPDFSTACARNRRVAK